MSTAPLPHSPSLSAQAIEVRYESSTPPVLAKLSLEIPPGRITALIGPNGSGKSTLLKALWNELAPSHGEVLIDGKSLSALSRREVATRVGALFQENVAPAGLTVEELVAQGRFPYRRLFDDPREDDLAAVDQALRRAGIEELRHWPIDRLSGGQRQLAWIALALAQTTPCLLLDEPTTFLDLNHQLEVMEVISSLRDDLALTIVMVLHDVNQAARHADHLVAMRNGRIVAEGAPASVLTPDLLRAVYGIEAEVLIASDGLPVCLARKRS
jgi:iron complex transport system ATP-binding protein